MADFPHNPFFSALTLESIINHRTRRRIIGILNLLIFLAVLPALYSLITSFLISFYGSVGMLFDLLPILPASIAGFSKAIFFIGLALRLSFGALEAFYYSRTDRNSEITSAGDPVARLNLYVAEIWHAALPIRSVPTIGDILAAIPRTESGVRLLERLGIEAKEYRSFLEIVGQTMGAEMVLREHAPKTNIITLGDLLMLLFNADETFKKLVLAKELRLKDLAGAGAWIEGILDRERIAERWWLRQNLGRIPGIGKHWSYGYTQFLEQFARPVRVPSKDRHLIGREREVEILESALLRASGANVLIVGEPGAGKRALLTSLAGMIADGTIFPDLEHKQVLELDGAAVIAAGKTKGEIELLLLRILNESVRAGNVILAITDFPEFCQSLESAGVSPAGVLTSFLQNQALHFICLANTASSRRLLEKEKGLLEYFEKIELDNPSTMHLIAILEDVVSAIERTHGHRVIITYACLAAVAESAERYLIAGGLPERAVNLLEEAAQEADSLHLLFCTPDTVAEQVKKKTNIPLGDITTQERDKLMHLESDLHKRIIGQHEAVIAVANAVRRGRANLSEGKRPIGTFLFLGPTGVGKTETAKALAQTYFGDEEAMVRLDMTEYQDEEGIPRLIGSFEHNQQGLLASTMRAKPYAVVLLDEFEKTNQKVIDLFLQILDEGFFTDAFGERINMRNTIIIATSNAGSSMILESIGKGISHEALTKAITEHINQAAIFKPELLNRFDAIIVFKPLELEGLGAVARLMLERLVNRLKERNIALAIADDLIATVVKGGYSPAFVEQGTK